MTDRDSLETEAQAAAKLASSARVRALLGYVVAAVVLPAAGWVGAKLDTKLEVDRMSGKIDVLAGEVAVLTSQQRDLVKSIGALSQEPDGQLVRLSRDSRYAQRNAVRGIAMALSSARSSDQKKDAAERLASAFDRFTAAGKSASDAAELTLAKIAVQ